MIERVDLERGQGDGSNHFSCRPLCAPSLYLCADELNLFFEITEGCRSLTFVVSDTDPGDESGYWFTCEDPPFIHDGLTLSHRSGRYIKVDMAEDGHSYVYVSITVVDLAKRVNPKGRVYCWVEL